MRALIAARKSNKADGGREGASLDTQDELAREFCKRMGFRVIGVARDTISGRVAPIDRKDLGKWLNDPARLATFDILVAYRSDRLSRGSDTDWSRIEAWAADNRKTLCLVDSSTGIRYPARDDSDFWQYTAAKRQAGAEWVSIQERNVRAQTALMASGSVMTSAPYGYRIVGALYAKRLEVVPHEAQIVREVFGRVTSGESLSAVAAWFTETTGHRVGITRIHTMILNPVYAGRLERNGQLYGECPAIVTMAEWTTAQRAMKSRAKKPAGGRPSQEPALMVMICGEDGAKMYRSGGHRGDYRYYCKNPGHQFGVPVEKADAAVLQALASSSEDEMRVEVTPGRDWTAEIETAKRDQLQALARQDMDAVVKLSAVIKDLEGREVEPDRVEPKPTGRTVGQKFEAMSREDIRVELRAWTITAWPDGRLKVRVPWDDAE